jgi:putative pyoverdin transport system ATP-binding/permease protein
MKIITDTFRLIAFLLRSARGIKHARTSIVLIILTGVIGGLGVTTLVALVSTALGRVGSPTRGLIWGFAALCIVSPVMRFASQALLVRLTGKSVFILRMRLCRQIMSAPLRQQEEIGSHRLLATLTEDIPVIVGALAAIPTLFVNIAILVGCLVYMGWISWVMLLSITGFMIVGIISYQIPVSRAWRYFRLAREEADAMFRQYRAITDGGKELKLHRRRRKDFASELESTTKSLQDHNIAGNTIHTAAADWGEILFFVFIGLVLFVLPLLIQVEAPTLMAYVLIVLFIRTPLIQVLNTVPGLGRAAIAAGKVESLGLSLLAGPSEADLRSDPHSDRNWSTLELSGVTHSYHGDGDDEGFTVGPLDMTLRRGELVFLVGGNGSGKTTLGKLLTGLYSPDSGDMRLDGELITARNRDDYRQFFSAVFSDFYLFESLLGFDGNGIDDLARESLIKLQLDRKVSVENGAFSTIDLSQGQRKRLALLAACLEDRPIYLFDEWAADQDALFRDVFYYQILAELKEKGKTILVISHDDRYYHIADRIIKLDYGMIVTDESVTGIQDSLTPLSAPQPDAGSPHA